ncbi:hypothetical protein [Micromonospora sp. DT47]|uniref:hypothetical protein n=1 Tax=Micromonospora sp. DT47 TaxID=3393431 RepID=UPI003CE7B194
MLTPPDEDEGFGWILTGDTELADATGQNERDLSVTLARTFGVRALVDDGSLTRPVAVPQHGRQQRACPHQRGRGGRRDLRIVHALEPISGEPQLAVVPPPDCARDW